MMARPRGAFQSIILYYKIKKNNNTRSPPRLQGKKNLLFFDIKDIS